MICLSFVTIHGLAAFFRTVELGLFKEVEVLSLDFLFLELLGAQRALVTLPHPAIDAFLAVRPFAVCASDHVF